MKDKQLPGLTKSIGPKPVLRRLMPGLTALLLLLIGSAYWVLMSVQENQLRDTSLMVKQQAAGDLEQLLAEQARGLEAVQVPLLRDTELIAALKAGDREHLLELSKPLFGELNARYEVTHFYFSDAQRVCLLRVHHPEKHGDRFDRFTALEAERTGQVASGIELGPLGTFTLRVVRPVFEDGQLVGYLELGKEIEDVLDSIVTVEGVEKILAIRKDALDRTRWEAGMTMLGREADWDRLPDHAVIYASMPLPAEAERLIDCDEHDHADASDEIRFVGKVWRAMSQSMADVSGHEVGELLLLQDVTKINAAHQQWKMAVLMGSLALLAVLLAIVFVMLRRTDAGIHAQQAELRESREYLSATLRSIGDGVIVCDREVRVASLNRVAETLTGWTSTEAAGRPLAEVFRIIHAKTRKTAENPVFRALAEGVNVDLANHTALISKDGAEHQIADSCAPIRDASGAVIGAVLVFRDVTEEYRRREKLRKSKAELSEAHHLAKMGRWDFYHAENQLRWSDNIYHIFEIDPEQFKASYEAFLATIHPDDRNAVDQAWKQSLADKKPYNIEHRLLMVDGRIKWVQEKCRTDFDKQGRPVRSIGIVQDITERRQAEDQIRFLAEITANIFDAIVVTDAEFRINYINKNAEELFGYTPTELLGKTPDILNADPVAMTLQRELYERVSAGNLYTGESLNRRKEGSTFFCEYRVMPMLDHEGKIVAYIGVQRDITERKQEEAAKQFHFSFQQTVAELSVRFLTVAADTQDEAIAFTLHRLGTLFGVDRGYVFGFSDDLALMTNTHEWCAEGIEPQMERIQNVPTDDMPWWKAKIQQINPVHIPSMNGLPPGAQAEREEFSAQGIQSLLCLPMIDQRGHLTGFMGFDAVREARSWSELEIEMLQLTTDLLASAMGRTRALRELAESERQLELFFSQSLHGFFMCMLDEPIEWNDQADKDKLLEYVLDHQRMTKVNEAMLDQYGASESDFVGITVRELFKHDRDHARETWRGLFDRGNWHVETYQQKMDGTPTTIGGHYICLYDKKGRITGHFGVQVDITDRKLAERELAQMNAALEEQTVVAKEMAARAEVASIAKSEFLANMSHEIRTPMNGVIGMTGLLLDTALTEEQRRYAEIVRSSGESLLGVINDILDFSKIEAGKLELEALDFDLGSLLDDFASALTLRAHDKGLELLCAADPDVPTLLKGDPGRLRQILTNLTGNAIKFTEKGEVVVRVGRVQETETSIQESGVRSQNETDGQEF